MDTRTQSTLRLSPLLILFTLSLLLLLSSCGVHSNSTGTNNTIQQTPTAHATPQPTPTTTSTLQVMPTTQPVVSTPTLQVTEQYEFTEQDSGKTYINVITSRFSIILNTQKYPKNNFLITCNPTEVIGSISNLPSVIPPLYAVRYEGVQPGTCTIKNGTFFLNVRIIPLQQ